MTPTSKFAVICCCMALFAACKKDDGNNSNNLSPTGATLVAGKWQLSAATATLNYMGKDTTMDVYNDEECKKDDIITFASNGKVTLDEGANICPGHSKTSTVPWALLNNDTKLAVVDSNPDTMDLEITTAQMKLKIIKPNSSGSPVTYIDTYKNIK